MPSCPAYKNGLCVGDAAKMIDEGHCKNISTAYMQAWNPTIRV